MRAHLLLAHHTSLCSSAITAAACRIRTARIPAPSRLARLRCHFSDDNRMAANGTAGTTARLTALRDLMKEKDVDIYGTHSHTLQYSTPGAYLG